jgi:hypothetical protein
MALSGSALFQLGEFAAARINSCYDTHQSPGSRNTVLPRPSSCSRRGSVLRHVGFIESRGQVCPAAALAAAVLLLLLLQLLCSKCCCCTSAVACIQPEPVVDAMLCKTLSQQSPSG